MSERTEGLLDVLAAASGCDYVSDLRLSADPALRERVALAVEAIPSAAWPEEEWARALAYLAGERPAPHGAEALRARLLDAARGRL